MLLSNPPPSDPVLMTTVVFVRLRIRPTNVLWLTVNAATCGRVCVGGGGGVCVCGGGWWWWCVCVCSKNICNCTCTHNYKELTSVACTYIKKHKHKIIPCRLVSPVSSLVGMCACLELVPGR